MLFRSDLKPAFNKFILAKNNFQQLNVEFLPILANISANCQLIIYYSAENCSDSLVINLLGNSFAKGKCDFSFNNINDIVIDPKSPTLTIPISIKSPNSPLFLQDTIEINISFPRSIYFPIEITNSTQAKIIKNELNADKRILTIQNYFNQNLEADKSYIFAEISGIPLLGDISSGIFQISGAQFLARSDQYEAGTLDILNFSLKVCNSGSERLLKFNEEVKQGIIEIDLQENNQNLTITFSAVEKDKIFVKYMITLEILFEVIHFTQTVTKLFKKFYQRAICQKEFIL